MTLSAFELFERRLLGREPLYAPRRITARLAARLGTRLDRQSARRLGWAMRALYAYSLGVVCAWLDPDVCRSPNRVIRHGLAISAFEMTVLPSVGALPPLDAWPIAELILLIGHATAFAVGAEISSALPGERSVV